MVELSSTALTPELKEIMRQSLKKDRWEPLDLGAASNYTSEAVQARWEKSRQEWVNVSDETTDDCQSDKNLGKNNENDARGTEKTSTISPDPENLERRQIKRIMKSLQGPYDRFKHHYPLEEVVDIYMEIWYDSSSSSNEE